MNLQKTIKNEIHVNGAGIHTGKEVNVTLHPAPENYGIVFRRVDLNGKPDVKAAPDNILKTDVRLQRTSLKNDAAEIHTIEHLMAALSGLGIDNCLVDIDGVEMPALDGSAKGWVEKLKDAGFGSQTAPKRFIELKEHVVCENGASSIEARPYPGFKIEFFLEFTQPWLENQSLDISVDSSEGFFKFFQDELAPSRTFCFEEEVLMLLRAGLGKGANLENTLVMGKEGPINNTLRFHDELVRHKILDLLGDLYILGGHMKGHVVARKSGHQLNTILVREIYKNSKVKTFC